ncbi:hypothetical protein SODALDRAFT_332301 [Sodiomyces alkalinus F11]|uniref:C2H2-type domain-containing protein n=1 Tax=Sodiomyces alkalinus (strain CBS 110278 / VKM F-3762 / F11) TaxID=1314773 RepID=A0A3N2Q041_SODAK|nr:hypothetical protein SODALDRAFT_332301 [Sodiomyces alkalinus F11]ROT40140.1 hypothetical protein SODALDRAFT_332301 [Sodiomyces alkalinus F11]
MIPPLAAYNPDSFSSYSEASRTTYTSSPLAMTGAAVFEQSSTIAESARLCHGGNLCSPGTLEDGDLQVPPFSLSTASVPSAASSAVGSPQSHHGHPGAVPDWTQQKATPSIVPNETYNLCSPEYTSFGPGMEEFVFELTNSKLPGFVDPSLVLPSFHGPVNIPVYDIRLHSTRYPTSPSASSSPQQTARHGSRSPFLHEEGQQSFSPFPTPVDGRPQSVLSFPTSYSDKSTYNNDEVREKQRCPHPECGKSFKDLKAHMLTHQNERPEKCPIQTCDYHSKGFARKYDKNRHTLTHYKGTMVCGFCPGSGSAAEKSFNRADVFKRHLTAVHGVEQSPPNSRKKSSAPSDGNKATGYPPDATGKCSTCSQIFSNAQDFYEHLDDCVLRIVQQEDPAEAINARLLAEVENDEEVHQTLERNSLPSQTQSIPSLDDEDEDEDMEDNEGDGGDSKTLDQLNSPMKTKTAAIQTGQLKSRGLTHSRVGVPLRVKTKGRKNKQTKPLSWGYDRGLLTMKKRVLGVFDGPRRLSKDDMMLSTEHEVRIKLSDGKSYVTDLDMATLRRAEGFHSATEEEKGVWISDDPTEEQFKEMQELQDALTGGQGVQCPLPRGSAPQESWQTS